MSQANTFIDVHTFDEKLTDPFPSKHSKEEKLMIFNKVLHIFHNMKLSFQSCQGLKLIIDDIGTPANYDDKNKLYVDDILMEICELLTKNFENQVNDDIKDIFNFLGLLAEQLSDMYTLGRCSQGRSTRLYQLYKSLKDLN
jgi:hypothetical protein